MDKLIHADWKNHKYLKKIKTASGQWRYVYDNKGKTVTEKKYNEYDVDYHKMYTTTERTVNTDSLFTPMKKTEIHTDSEGKHHKTVTDYDGKVERAVEAGTNFIARTLKKTASDIAFKRAANDLLKDYKKKAGIH